MEILYGYFRIMWFFLQRNDIFSRKNIDIILVLLHPCQILGFEQFPSKFQDRWMGDVLIPPKKCLWDLLIPPKKCLI